VVTDHPENILAVISFRKFDVSAVGQLNTNTVRHQIIPKLHSVHPLSDQDMPQGFKLHGKFKGKRSPPV
jgi:hypothetical protein